MKKKVKVIMLPAEDKSRSIGQIVKAVFPHPKAEIGELFISDMNVSESQEEPQHLYFVSVDEVKASDYVYWEHSKTKISEVVKVSKHFVYFDNELSIGRLYCRKIIATTDKSLTVPKITNLGMQEECGGILQVKSLPQIPQSFIESYVKNPIEEVELVTEYVPGKVLEGVGSPSKQWKLTLNQNNEVIISTSTLEPKMYTRLEVEEFHFDSWITKNNTNE